MEQNGSCYSKAFVFLFIKMIYAVLFDDPPGLLVDSGRGPSYKLKYRGNIVGCGKGLTPLTCKKQLVGSDP